MARFRSPRLRPRPLFARQPLTERQVAALRLLGAPAASAPVVGESVQCIAYMCPWAYACSAATPRPANVDRRRCMRYWPELHRPDGTLTEMALDLLASQRQRGEQLGAETMHLLDAVRPNGPSHNLGLRHPRYAGPSRRGPAPGTA